MLRLRPHARPQSAFVLHRLRLGPFGWRTTDSAPAVRTFHQICSPFFSDSGHLCKITSTASTNGGRANSTATTRGGGRLTAPTPPFGVVAAMTKDRVIGVDGKLPWGPDFTPQDWEHFVNLTRDKILIMGRKSFAEEPTGGHINHARVCVVVSRTMTASDLDDGSGNIGTRGNSGPEVKLARSFDEALDLASKELPTNYGLQLDQTGSGSGDDASPGKNDTIMCWVAGGERIYQEALQHVNAKEVHLTHVDMTVDLDECRTTNSTIAYFPRDYLESNGFREVTRVNSGMCTFCTYKRPARN